MAAAPVTVAPAVVVQTPVAPAPVVPAPGVQAAPVVEAAPAVEATPEPVRLTQRIGEVLTRPIVFRSQPVPAVEEPPVQAETGRRVRREASFSEMARDFAEIREVTEPEMVPAQLRALGTKMARGDEPMSAPSRPAVTPEKTALRAARSRVGYPLRLGVAAAVAAILLIIFFGGASPAHASRASADAVPPPPVATSLPVVSETPVPQSLFHYGTSGAATTGLFTSSSPFTLNWSASCTNSSPASVVTIYVESGDESVITAVVAHLDTTSERYGTSRVIAAGAYSIVGSPIGNPSNNTCIWSVQGVQA